VTITATFGVLSVVASPTTVAEIFAFAGGAVLAYAIVDGVASGGFRHGPRDEEPVEVTALGSSVSFVSVGWHWQWRSWRRDWWGEVGPLGR
jgi:threonine/homoserine/homoserine lactone efflux protein